MVCKFRADSMLSPCATLARHCGVLAVALAAAAAWAEKADRSQNWVIEADRPVSIDAQRNVMLLSGNAVVSQGSMVLRADRIEMREMPDGYRAATAIGSAGKPALWKQRRDGGEETVEGTADRIDYDGHADTLRFTGHGQVRRLRGGVVADEITGASIVWDNSTELFKAEGGSSSASNPAGRVRVVLSPRVEAASAPPGAAPSVPLTPSRSLGDKR